ncbi:B12-binding domain-containing radical SAM protein [bacterium]|nr:B12-binding domain-containing radical SAM protein [bacterium]
MARADNTNRLPISDGRPGAPRALFIRTAEENGPHPRDRVLPFSAALSGAMLGRLGFGAQLAVIAPGATPDLADRPDAVFVEIPFGRMPAMRRVIDAARDVGSMVAAFGSYAEAHPGDVLDAGADAVIGGDPEPTAGSLVSWWSARRAGAPPVGLILRDGHRMRSTGAAPLARTDDLPFVPARLLATDRFHKYSFPLAIGERARWGFILATRGCFYDCAFCSSMARQSAHLAFRACEPERLVAEMEYQVREARRNVISIEDEIFTGHRRWALEVCRQLGKRRLGVPWIVQTRLDHLDEELAAAMKAAGCVGMTCGVESGSDAILERLNKKTTVADIRQRAAMLDRFGFRNRYTFMIGAPGETREDFQKTEALACALNPLVAQMSFCTPYPDTALAADRPGDTDMRHVDRPRGNLSAMSDVTIARLRRRFYRRYYLSSRYLRAHGGQWLAWMKRNPSRAIEIAGHALSYAVSAASIRPDDTDAGVPLREMRVPPQLSS